MLTKEGFINKYCLSCDFQRCGGPGSEMLEGCRLKRFIGENNEIEPIQDFSKEELEKILYSALDDSGIEYDVNKKEAIAPEKFLPLEMFSTKENKKEIFYIISEMIVKRYCKMRCGWHFYRCPQSCDTVNLIDSMRGEIN